jgi:pimeloyl-ACP methyl ester carboxylesterase
MPSLASTNAPMSTPSRLGASAPQRTATSPEDGQNNDGVYVYDFTTNLSRYTTPVLFIAGDLNEVIGAAFQQEQLSQYPAATLRVVQGAGHDVNWTHAPEVLAYVRQYLDARRGGSR